MNGYSSYTAEQDAVLLSHRSIGDVQAEFARRGWPARSRGALIQRRLYLQKKGQSTQFLVGDLLRRRRQVLVRRENLGRQLLRAQDRLRQVEMAIRDADRDLSAVDDFLEELGVDPEA